MARTPKPGVLPLSLMDRACFATAIMLCVWFFAAGCTETPPKTQLSQKPLETAETPSVPRSNTPKSETKNAPQLDPIPDNPPIASRAWLDYVATHCTIDDWIPHLPLFPARRYSFTGQWPSEESKDRFDAMMAPKSPEQAQTIRADLEKKWFSAPTSHVLDCTLRVEARDCPGCRRFFKPLHEARYMIYLPAAYFRDPDAIKTLLFLIPGGSGGRTRWFRDPIKGRRQGLSTASKVDAWLKKNPNVPAPILMSIDDPRYPFINGVVEFFTHDLLEHVLATYLPGKTHKDFAIGVESISLGGRVSAEAAVAKPDLFNTIGWLAMFCGPRGFYEKTYFGRPNKSGEKAMKVWQKRAKDGELFIKSSIGKNDTFLECTRSLHDRLVAHNVIPSTPKRHYRDCTASPDPSTPRSLEEQRDCVMMRQTLTEYPRIPHGYWLMPLAYDEHLHWHIETLAQVAQAKGL